MPRLVLPLLALALTACLHWGTCPTCPAPKPCPVVVPDPPKVVTVPSARICVSLEPPVPGFILSEYLRKVKADNTYNGTVQEEDALAAYAAQTVAYAWRAYNCEHDK